MTDVPADKTSKKMPQKVDDDDQLLPDLNGSRSGIECETCGVSFSDVKNYENHMQGKKHQKKVAEAKLMAKNLADDKGKNAKEDLDKDDDDEDEDDEEMHCDVCNKFFSGYISYMAHMKGSLHTKNVKKLKLKKQIGSGPDVLDEDEEGSDDDGIVKKPFAKCNLCQKEFSGPENYHLHMKSILHKKKVKQSKYVDILKPKDEDETKHSDDEEFFNKCEVCQKSFSGVVPYKVHMESGAHRKSLEKQKVAEEYKEFYDESSEGFVCKECKKIFSNALAFKSHLDNNSHEKQKAKSALMEFLNAHPEIVITYPLENSENEGDSDEAEDPDFFLICKLCHMSFTGPASAQDHVKSKKHLSAKKEKKAMKLIKEKKKNFAVESGDTDTKDGRSKDSSSKSPGKVDVSENGKVPKSTENPHENSGEHDDFELI